MDSVSREDIDRVIIKNYSRLLKHVKYKVLKGGDKFNIYSAEDILHLAIDRFLRYICGKIDKVDRVTLEGYVVKSIMNSCQERMIDIFKSVSKLEGSKEELKMFLSDQCRDPLKELEKIEYRNMMDSLNEDVVLVIKRIEDTDHTNLKNCYTAGIADALGISRRMMDYVNQDGNYINEFLIRELKNAGFD